MVKGYISLSTKDSNLLQDAIVRYGRIVLFNQLKSVFEKAYSASKMRNRFSLLTKNGWLKRLKKGLYIVITDLGSLGSNDVSIYTISQALNKDSYVSFESALGYHGLFDQMLSSVGAVTFRRARAYKIKDQEVRFFNIKKELYFGFTRERSDIGLVNIAQREKALLDILYFCSNRYYSSLVWEKLSEHKKAIDFDLLKKYAAKFNLDVVRQTGFFLDLLGIQTSELKLIVAGKTGYSRMTKDSKDFNAKWRLYYDDRITH